MGEPILDLEALARHRGSIFGTLAGTPHSTQKWFESSLLDRRDRLDPRAFLLLRESEGFPASPNSDSVSALDQEAGNDGKVLFA
jgi:hypothetical protein